jgi:hypothetical protein
VESTDVNFQVLGRGHAQRSSGRRQRT